MLKKDSLTTAKDDCSATPLDLNECLSAAQYRKIIELAAELECDADQASHTLFGVSAEALSRSGADDLIEYLQRLKG